MNKLLFQSFDQGSAKHKGQLVTNEHMYVDNRQDKTGLIYQHHMSAGQTMNCNEGVQGSQRQEEAAEPRKVVNLHSDNVPADVSKMMAPHDGQHSQFR